MTTYQKSLALTIAVSVMTLSLCSSTQAEKRKRNNSSSSKNNSSKNSFNQKRFDNKYKNQNNKKQNNTQNNSDKKYNFDKNRNDKNYKFNKNDKNYNNNSSNYKKNETNKKWDLNKKYNADKNKNYNNNKSQWKGNQNNSNRNQNWSVSKNRINEGEYKGKYKWHSGVYKSYKPYQKNYYVPKKKGFDFTYRHQKKKTYINPYSTPIVVSRPAPVVTGDRPAPAFDDSVQLVGQEDLVTETDEGKDDFELAREAFFAGDLKSALSLIEQSSKKMPGNPNVQQFRSLVLFAMKDYNKSAAAAYTALTIGPGWDWETLSSLFPSVEIYTSLLRSLEADMKKDPSITSKKFLLAYHYLMLDEKEAAGRQLAAVVKAEPRNEVALQLFKSTGGTPIVEKPAPPKPME